MKRFKSQIAAGLAILAVAVMMPAVGVAEDGEGGGSVEVIANGKASYMASCASCHGESGMGDGSVAEYLTVKPSDLTKIAKGADGEFPFDAIYQVIDGRSVPGHGSRGMPVWGPAFMGMDESAGKATVKEKIVELVYYLKSIQG